MTTLKFFSALFLFCLLIGCSKEEVPTVDQSIDLKTSTFTSTGNEAPNGQHYNLNIIGTKEKSGDMDGSNGHVIFVPLEGKTKIELQMGDFAVLDANGTDGVAQFQLPDPDLDPYIIGEAGDADTYSDYSVFVRPLGKPGGWSTMTTVADIVDSGLTDFLNNKEIKEINKANELGGTVTAKQVGMPITFTRNKGKSTFTNVTAELLTVVIEVEYNYEEDGEEISGSFLIRVPIFDDIIENEFWEYDNYGLRILQLRFYPGVQTNVTNWD